MLRLHARTSMGAGMLTAMDKETMAATLASVRQLEQRDAEEARLFMEKYPPEDDAEAARNGSLISD